MKPMKPEQFLVDVAKHKMTIKCDSGLYRHLLFRQPENSWNLWFEVVTWPNCLTINGDMGTWTFSRVEDMFTFFRSDTLRINASYWHEKIQSESRFGGPSQKFHPDVFKANVLSSLDGYGLKDQDRTDITAALESDVFSHGEDESECRRMLERFKHDEFRFSEPWEISGNAYTYHFLWCLHAIVWAIQQYDAATRKPEDPARPATPVQDETKDSPNK